jgi:hypothetical protein
LNARRDGRAEDAQRFEAVTLTKTARRFIERNGALQEGQRVYSGLVKPREAEHDCQICRAYLKEIERNSAGIGLASEHPQSFRYIRP